MIGLDNQGSIVFHLLLAGLLTLLVGLLLLVAYRRSVRRWMSLSAVGGVAGATLPSRPVAARIAGPLPEAALELRRASDRAFRRRFCSATFRGAERTWLSAALVYTLAGLAHAATATALQILFGIFDFVPIRATVVFWAYAWPVVLTLILFWGSDRRRQLLTVAAYLGILAGLATIVTLGSTQPLALSSIPSLAEPASGTAWISELADGITLPAFAQPLFVWALFATPTSYLLLFLNRRVRAIGPVLLLFMIIVAAGSHVATVLMGLFLRAVASAAVATETPVELWFYGLPIVGMIVFAVPGWMAARWIARRYARKRLSDQQLVFDAIWLFASLLLCQSLIQDVGPAGWAGLASFAAYKIVTRVGLAPLAARAAAQPPAQLLLLRVFGYQRRTERLFSQLSARWRYAGPVQLIAAPDLATANVEPHEFLDFLSGRLRRAFITSEADLGRRFAERDLRPDPDGRFRVNEFFCTNDTWQAAVIRLMADAHLVAMDLRGFSPGNRGCLFEIETLVARVPAARIAFLIDRTTDLDLLTATLANAMARLDATSPNAGGGAPLRVLQIARRNQPAVRALLHLADDVLAKTAT